MKEQLYKYTVKVCEFYDTPSHEAEITNTAVDEKGCELWYYSPEEAIKKMEELDEDAPDNKVYLVQVDRYCDPYER
jgi:hypothetical protein